MRFFALILSIYVFTLSVVSCADSMESHSELSKLEVSVDIEKHNHSENCNDFCSPFCTCACCGTVVTLTDETVLKKTSVGPEPKYSFHYSFDYSFNHKIGVWRPPNLA